MKFVIFHGSMGSSEGNWLPNLKSRLKYMGQTIYCPQYPVDNLEDLSEGSKNPTKQNLNSWLETFEKEVLPNLKGKEKICFIGHSLGNVFILHVIEKFKIKLDCAIFVSPCLDRLPNVPWYYDLVNTTFYKTDFDFENLQKYIPISYVLYSDTDPYIEPHRALHFAKVMGSSHILVRKAGHMNSEVNMNEFPLVHDLCMTRLELSLYQKYAQKREVEDAVGRLKYSEQKYFQMTPEHLNDEGTFHFMNLIKGGFATFMSNSADWDPENGYFVAGRKLAEKGLDITRVFIVVDKKDLKREILRKQIKLDMKAGIKVYYIDFVDYESINCEKDFGIWDNEYVCIQNRNEKGEITGGLIDARVKSLLTAQNWRDRIIRLAKRVEKV